MTNILQWCDDLNCKQSNESVALATLRRQTHDLFPSQKNMLSGLEVGPVLQGLTQMSRATYAVEVGTFTGYSAAWIARGLPAEGQLFTLDIEDDTVEIGKEAWKADGLDSKITFIKGDAMASLQTLESEGKRIGFAFIDADKRNYIRYYEQLLTLSQPGTVICFDNVWWSGKVIDDSEQDADTVGLRKLSELLAVDDRVQSFTFPIRDGLTVAVVQ